jgi:uncharacterized protein with PIN domain
VVYLLRFAEVGREAQPGRQATRRDLRAELLRALPSATVREAPGRLLVESDRGDAEAAVAALHGLVSWSPCRVCTLGELDQAIVTLAREGLARPPAGRNPATAVAAGCGEDENRLSARRFRVRVKRAGAHPFGSPELAARLGRRIAEQIPGAVVDLDAPELTLGVEVRDGACWIFDRVVPGRDQLPAAAAPPGEVRFLVDQMLGRLAAWLRLLGFDAAERRHRPDSELLRVAAAEGRVLVTRDRALARTRSARVISPSGARVGEQLAEVLAAAGLVVRRARLFTRCTRCNLPVEPVAREAVRGLVPAAAFREHDRFTRCPSCRRVYWRGGHYLRVLARIADRLVE